MVNNFFNKDDDSILDFISKKDIYNNLTLDLVEYFLNTLGVDVKKTDKYLICPTICHNPLSEATSMKLYFYKENLQFHCYTECSENMTIFELYRRFMELNYSPISEEEAEFQVKKILFPNLNFTFKKEKKNFDLNKYKKEKYELNFPIFSKNLLDCFINFEHPSWLKDGITKKEMEKFDIKFSIYQNKIIIPHYDLKGNLIGIRGRSFNQEDLDLKRKYMPVMIGKDLYAHHLGYNLYGIHEHSLGIKKYKKAIVYEGEKSVLLDDKYYGTDSFSVASCGWGITLHQVKLLIENFGVNEIVIAFDKEFTDPFGEKGKQYREKIIKLIKKYRMFCNFSYIFDEKGLLEEKDSPIDKGKEIFEKLYNNRFYMK